MKITALRRLKGRGARLEVEVDGEVRAVVSGEVATRAGLRVGDGVDEAGLRALEAREQQWLLRESALRLLSHRPRTERELRQRLLRKGFPTEMVEDCLTELGERGYLDDGAFARGFVRDRVRLRPKGPGLLAGELRARGLEASEAERAIAEVLREEETTELDLARAALQRWSARQGEEPQRARRRLHGYLTRRGFSADVVRELVEERLGRT